MPAYEVIIQRAAKKQLSKLPIEIKNRISEAIDALELDPRPHGVEKMSGEENMYRVRVGDYRIIYSIYDDRLIVLVVRVGPRKDVYRGR